MKIISISAAFDQNGDVRQMHLNVDQILFIEEFPKGCSIWVMGIQSPLFVYETAEAFLARINS